MLAKNSHWIPMLLEEFHASPQTWHSVLYTPHISVEFLKFIQTRDTCQRQKYVYASPRGLV